MEAIISLKVDTGSHIAPLCAEEKNTQEMMVSLQRK
jgi:hypothetical protein